MIRPEQLSIKDVDKYPIRFDSYDSQTVSPEEALCLRNALEAFVERQLKIDTGKSIYAARLAETMRDYIFCSGKSVFTGRVVVALDTSGNLLGFNFREKIGDTVHGSMTAVDAVQSGRGIGSMMVAIQNVYLADELGLKGYHAILDGGEVMMHRLGVTWRLDPPGNSYNRYWIGFE